MKVMHEGGDVPDEVLARHPGLPVLCEGTGKLYEKVDPASIGLASYASGRILKVGAGGTLPAFEGKGLGTRLRKAAVELARRKGFYRMLVEPAHPATVHIWNK